MVADLMGGANDDYGDEYGEYGDESGTGTKKEPENAIDDFM